MYKLFISLFLPFIFVPALAQESVSWTFDDGIPSGMESKGKVQIVKDGAYKGRALRLGADSKASFRISLRPSSTYRVTACMRTESGADAMTMQVNGLGANNVSVSTALAGWTKFEQIVHVSNGQKDGVLQFSFGNSQGNTHAWVDEVTVQRVGDYREIVYKGIPKPGKRQVRTDMGLAMQSDEKIKWMLDDKLGMFIHWGLYAGPGKGEWYMENNGVSPETYRKLAYPQSDSLYFDARDFNAGKWVALAKKMGARYMCLTTQHHDGYALFESKYMNAFTSKQTHNRDFVKEYVDACRAAGLKVGLYKTLINWRFPGYYDVTGTDCKPNKFGYKTDSSHKENARLMKEELYCQIKELMTKYGKIDQLFWDGGWLAQQGSDRAASYFWEPGKYMNVANQWPVNPYFQDKDSTGRALGIMGIVRKYQPDIVANSRSGWIGDYGNEEGGGAVKGPIRTNVVEKCFTLAPGWGYSKMMENPSKIMPLKDIKRIFADCIVRNMCCMINVGPDRHGNVPPLIEQRLTDFGHWVDCIKEAVYGTRGGPWQPVDGQYGFAYKGNTIYVYFLGDYKGTSFTLPPLDKGMKVKKAYDVISGKKIKIRQKEKTVTLTDLTLPGHDISVLALELNKPVI